MLLNSGVLIRVAVSGADELRNGLDCDLAEGLDNLDLDLRGAPFEFPLNPAPVDEILPKFRSDDPGFIGSRPNPALALIAVNM